MNEQHFNATRQQDTRRNSSLENFNVMVFIYINKEIILNQSECVTTPTVMMCNLVEQEPTPL